MEKENTQLSNTEYQWDLKELRRLAQEVQKYEELYQDSPEHESCQAFHKNN